ncbi:MAG TPA: FecR family protein [Methylomirabilota bacterium]|nr:FecR family protein [Methylomirabilota bacterium]
MALALLVTLWPAAAVAQTRAGIVTNLEGSATAARSAAPQPVALKFKDDVFQNDRIVTLDRSIVRLLLGGKAVVTVRERSSLTITEVPGKTTVDLDVGKIAVAVARERMKPGEQIEVKTPNAVAAVRGTVFIIEVIRATAQATPGGPGGVTTNGYWYGGTGTMTFGTTVLNMGPGNFASGLGTQLPTFIPVMSQQLSNQGAAGLGLQGQNMAAGRQGSNEQAFGTTVVTFNQGAGLPQVAGGGDTPPPPPVQITPTAPLLPGGSQNLGGGVGAVVSGGGFKPAGTPTGILVFGDRANGSTLSSDLAGFGHTVTMNVSTLPMNLSSFGTIWHISAFAALTADEQTRLAAFLALGRGLHLTGEHQLGCCDALNNSLVPFLRSVVVGGSGITLSGFGSPSGPYSFNSSARGRITTTPNVLTTWTAFAPGGIGGISGANVLVTSANGTPVGAVWDSGDLVRGAGRLTLLLDSDWIFGELGFSNANRLLVIKNIETYIDDPPVLLSLSGPLFRSTGEHFESAGSFLQIAGYTVTGSGSDPLLWLSGSRVTTAGDFVRMSDSIVSAAGSLTRIDNGGEIIQTSVAEPLVSMNGGTLNVGTGGAGHLFDLVGRPRNTQLDGDTGLTLGSDRPLQPGAESPVFEATNGAVVNVAGSAYRVDTALLEATAPLLNLISGASLTTGAHTVDLVGQAKVSIPNDAIAMINLNAASLTVTNGNLVNVAGGSQLNIAGSLLSLSGGSIVNILNGLLLNITGGSNVRIGKSLVSFSGNGNLLNVTNSFAPTAIIGGIPVYGLADSLRVTSPNALARLGSAGTIKINGVTLTPTTPLASLTGSLVAIQGSGSKVKVGN